MKFQTAIAAAIFATAAAVSTTSAWEKASFVARGDNAKATYDKGKWFVADSFSFGVEREMKESGEAPSGGGTMTMTMKKEFEGRDDLYRYYESGEAIPSMTISVAQPGERGKPVVYLKYKLDRCFIKSWSTSGDADDRPTEEVAFYYNKIAFSYAQTKDGKR